MNKRNITLAIVATASIFGSGTLWAQQGDHSDSDSSSMHENMMQDGEMMRDGEMMQDGMGMMNMMGQMESMMERCNSMMSMMQQEHHSSTDSGNADN